MIQFINTVNVVLIFGLTNKHKNYNWKYNYIDDFFKHFLKLINIISGIKIDYSDRDGINLFINENAGSLMLQN